MPEFGLDVRSIAQRLVLRVTREELMRPFMHDRSMVAVAVQHQTARRRFKMREDVLVFEAEDHGSMVTRHGSNVKR